MKLTCNADTGRWIATYRLRSGCTITQLADTPYLAIAGLTRSVSILLLEGSRQDD